MNRDSDGGLVSPSDVAVLANVTRAAVSNWRKRRHDFPLPIGGTTANPLFSRSEIEDWLNRNGHPVGRQSAEMAAWSTMNKYRGQLPIESMTAVAHALLCARKLFDVGPEWAGLVQAGADGRILDAMVDVVDDVGPEDGPLLQIPSVSNSTPALMESCAGELLTVVDGLPLTELADVSDHIVERVCSSEGRTGGQYGVVGSAVSTLLAGCAATVGGTVYDPACGIGETLLRTSEMATAKVVDLVGHDEHRAEVLLARQRCFLRGIPAKISDADVLTSDPDPALRADVVVAQLPLGPHQAHEFSKSDQRWTLAGPPPPKTPEFAWIQHVIAHLAPEARGYLLASPETTFAPRTAKMRRLLVDAGCVEAVIGLPPKMIPLSAVPAVLWVVCRPGASRFADSVLVIDASGLSPADELRVTEWLRQPSTLDSAHVAWTTVRVAEVLADEEVSLSPRGLTASIVDPQDIADRYVVARSDLAAALHAMGSADLISEGLSLPASRVATIRQLKRQGSVDVFRTRGRRNSEDPDQENSGRWIVTTDMVRDGLVPLPADEDLSSRRGENLTEPGDVLATTMRTLHAVVDETGGRSVGPGVIRLRVDRSQFNPGYIAACVTAGWNQRYEAGFYTPHANIRDLEIPVIPLADQERVVRNVEQARSVADAAKLASLAATELAETLLESVRFNVDLGE